MKKIVFFLLITISSSSVYASNFYLGANFGLTNLSNTKLSYDDYRLYSLHGLVYSSLGFNLKGYKIPARVEINYDTSRKGGINAYYDFYIPKDTGFTPYIGVGSNFSTNSFDAGLGFNYKINTHWNFNTGFDYRYNNYNESPYYLLNLVTGLSYYF